MTPELDSSQRTQWHFSIETSGKSQRAWKGKGYTHVHLRMEGKVPSLTPLNLSISFISSLFQPTKDTIFVTTAYGKRHGTGPADMLFLYNYSRMPRSVVGAS